MPMSDIFVRRLILSGMMIGNGNRANAKSVKALIAKIGEPTPPKRAPVHTSIDQCYAAKNVGRKASGFWVPEETQVPCRIYRVAVECTISESVSIVYIMGQRMNVHSTTRSEAKDYEESYPPYQNSL